MTYLLPTLWGQAAGANAKPEKLRLAALTLQQYFLGQGFASDKVVVNTRAADGAAIVFQGTDAQRRLVLLRYIGPLESEPASEKGGPGPTLWLSYVQDLQSPDVYRISKGQF